MSSRVGAKGNIVIDKSIRERLGVEPGWETIQLLRDGHVEIHFLPPAQPGSSAGILGPARNAAWLEDEDAFHDAVDRAMEQVARDAYPSGNAGPSK